ncbi:PREDICTED: E3 ubiquitin-protein ligase RNF170-like isoform X2 [Nicotiana attenuata]|uniref:E3 ubiquitin-protein ligase RNF170-like isoform X2 n=1 Tax=Nicotiana attenuata TaxID=49451 RepID=UPI0009046ED6|nr:PREDICTED: E3 ubiquitin-protein ligase RNF170-like isoform X2 [Nicotiana attenuata]
MVMGKFKIFAFGEREKYCVGVFDEEEMEEHSEKSPPAEDDHCPICFGDFTIPCRTNCGHWFCASCILQLWNYRSTLQPCKCPICCRPISKLVPEDSLVVQQEEDAVELLNDIRRYNHLYVGGAYGVFLKLVALPLLMQRILRSLMSKLMDPDHVKLNCYVLRLFADVWEYGDYLTFVLWPLWPFSIWLAYSVDGHLGVM